MKNLAGASSRPSGQHISPHTRPAINIKQEQGVDPSTMEGSPHDGWIDSTTTCRPTPPLPFTPQTDHIYLHNVQNGEDRHGKWSEVSIVFSDPEKIGQLLADSIFEAHQRTCLLSREQIQVGCSQGINDFKVEQFKKMVSVAQPHSTIIT